MKRTSIIAFVLALAACNPAALRPDGPERGEGESVSVALHLGVAPLDPGTPDTRVDREPDLDGGADWQEIRNVALMQFEWVDDDPDHVLQAQLVGQKQGQVGPEEHRPGVCQYRQGRHLLPGGHDAGLVPGGDERQHHRRP